MNIRFFISFWFLSVFLTSTLFGQQDSISKQAEPVVYVFDIKEQIAPPVWRKTQKALKEAHEKNAELIIIDMNTYGGMVESADSIRTAIMQSPIPVYTFINNNAASAGALISISSDSIYMRPGSNIGAATVVNQSGEQMPDKYQSYMRSTMRATAESNGRDPEIAEAMVDERIEIEGITEEGEVITFTSKEAIKHGFSEGERNSIKEILEKNGIKNYTIIEQQLTTTDKIIGWLISPVVNGILIMIIIGGLYFELQTPGLGFPSAASVIAALLYFAPLYLEGLAANWEILIFIAGVILVAIEIFALPGFGIAGGAGVLLVITGLTLSMVDNEGFRFTLGNLDNLAKAFFTVITAMLLSLVGSIYFGKRLFTTNTFGHLALDSVQAKEEGYTSVDDNYSSVIGKEGEALTTLRPSGKIEIDDETYDAFSDAGYIEKGTRIKVTGYTNTQLKVRKTS
ncbi:MAG: NfeD family protein [Bacteroidota bacterium]